jgi:hypothetical protein
MSDLHQMGSDGSLPLNASRQAATIVGDQSAI